ncbi:MAG: hypothetical protein ABH806_02605 [Candidatus Omnitrophota bacterium]
MRVLKDIAVFAIIFLALEMMVRVFLPAYKSLDHGKGITGGIPFTLNSRGLRDYEFESRKEQGAIRIMALGDSVTFGCQNKLSDTYSKQLEKMLNKDENKVYQVINCGLIMTSGVGTSIEYYGLLNSINGINPDLVILGFCLNDVGNVYYAKSKGVDLKHSQVSNRSYSGMVIPFNKTLSDKLNIMRWVLRKSALVSFFDVKTTRFLYKYGFKKYDFSRYNEKEEMISFGISPESRAAWEETLDYLGKIKRFLDLKGIKFFIVVFPFEFQVADNYFNIHLSKLTIDPQEIINTYCTDNNIAFLDLTAYFAREQKRLFFPMDYCHPNPLGNKIAARAIYKELKESGLLECLSRRE